MQAHCVKLSMNLAVGGSIRTCCAPGNITDPVAKNWQAMCKGNQTNKPNRRANTTVGSILPNFFHLSSIAKKNNIVSEIS